LPSGTVWYDSVPAESMVGRAANRALLLVVTMKLTVWLDSLAGPGWMFVAQFGTFCTAGAALAEKFWSAPLVKLGGWLTWVTLMTRVAGADVSWPPLAVPPSSCSATVMVALPKVWAAGVYDSVPLGLIDGATANSDGLVSPDSVKLTDWPDSLA